MAFWHRQVTTWLVSSLATVEAGDECDDIDVSVVTVTNTPELGCFNITKEIDEPEDMIGDLADLADVEFTVTIEEIRNLGSVLAGYNKSGEGVALGPSLPPTGRTNNADPQDARAEGDDCEAYWDTPEASKGKGKGKNK